MNTWKEPGRGRKQCSTCDLYVGVRAAACECGYMFYPAKAQPKKAEDELRETIASTLKYYARYFYDVFSEEYATVCSHINTIEKTGSLDV